MTDYFVNDGGDGSDGLTWAKAEVTWAAGIAHLIAGDRLIIGHDHVETPGASTTYVFPGTEAAPNIVISATSRTDATTTVAYEKASAAQLDLSTGAFDLTLTASQHVKLYGVYWTIGDDIRATGANRFLFEDCTVDLTSSNATFDVGGGAFSSWTFNNTDIRFLGGGTLTGFEPRGGYITFNGGSIQVTGTQPTALFDNHGVYNVVVLSGVDLSTVSSVLVDTVFKGNEHIHFQYCKLHASVALTIGSPTAAGVLYEMAGCDDTTGNDLYRLDYEDFYGTIVHDDAIFRTDGAKDPAGNNISWKMVTNANAAEFTEPLISPPITKWIKTTGEKTFKVNINWDSASPIQTDEAWIELESLQTASGADTKSTFDDDGLTNITTSPGNQGTNSEAWDGDDGFSNIQTQELSVTVTVNRVGPVTGRVHLAKPNTTIYTDPMFVVS